MDEFTANNHGFKLSLNNSIATKSSVGGGAVFLKNKVNSGAHQWRFRLAKGSYAVSIGVWKAKYKCINTKLLTAYEFKGKVYAFNVNAFKNGGTLTDGDGRTYEESLCSYSGACSEGDIIDMFLDLNKLELSFSVNEEHKGVAFKVENTSYIAVVSAFSGRSIELMSYKELTAMNAAVDDDNDDVKCNECMNMKQTIESLQQKNAELTMKLKAMTIKYNALYRKCNIDESNYNNWSCDHIADWIVGLNADYKQYENTLRANLKKEQVDGSLLIELDKSDLHRFGIIALKHKVAICQQIKRLIVSYQDEGKNETVYM